MARGKKNDQINIEDRRRKAFELRKGGASYRAIAQQLDCDVRTAFNDVDKELKGVIALNTHNTEELRQIELERLDRMLLSITAQVNAGHLGAIDRALRIGLRRAQLQGLDAPVKVQEITWRDQAIADIKAGTITYDALREAFDDSLASALFASAGVPVSSR
jgi:hypothetical protein